MNDNLGAKSIDIHLEEDAKRWIIDQTCGDRSYGARPLRRAVQKYIEDPVSELMIQGKLKEKQTLAVYLKDGALYYRPKGSKNEGALLSCGSSLGREFADLGAHSPTCALHVLARQSGSAGCSLDGSASPGSSPACLPARAPTVVSSSLQISQ